MQDEQNLDREDLQPQQYQQANTQQEPLLPQSKVNSIIKHEKERAFEKGVEHASKNSGFGSSEELNKFISEQVESKVLSKLNNIANEKMEQDFKNQLDSVYANTLKSIDDVKDKHQDFDEIKDNFKGIFGSMPEVVLHANQFENAGDILVELARNPSKAIAIQSLSKNKDSIPLASQEMKKLSNSLKLNANADSVKNTVKPISNINPSSIGIKGGKNLSDWTVDDWSNFSRKRNR